MGAVADRARIRQVALGAATMVGLCVLLAAAARELWQFYLLFLLAGLFAAGLFAPLIALVGSWFPVGGGLAIGIASGVLFVMLLAAIAGRVAFGRLADAIGPIPAWLAASFWQTAAVLGFTRIDDLAHFYVFAPIYGFGYAGVMTGVLITARMLTPPVRRATLMGVILAFAWLGHGLGGFQGGLLYDHTGHYMAGFAGAALAPGC